MQMEHRSNKVVRGDVANQSKCGDRGATHWDAALRHAAENSHMAAIELCAERGVNLNWGAARGVTSDPVVIALIAKLEH